MIYVKIFTMELLWSMFFERAPEYRRVACSIGITTISSMNR